MNIKELITELRRQRAQKNVCWPCVLLKDLMPLCDEFERLEREHRRAVEIADEAMLDLIASSAPHNSCGEDGQGNFDEYSLCDHAGEEVLRLEQADPAIREAFDWLSQRGLAELREDATGQTIVVKVLPDAVCISCGCDDHHACPDDAAGGSCYWLRLDRAAGLGVCSSCPELVEAWDSGVRTAWIRHIESCAQCKESPLSPCDDGRRIYNAVKACLKPNDHPHL